EEQTVIGDNIEQVLEDSESVEELINNAVEAEVQIKVIDAATGLAAEDTEAEEELKAELQADIGAEQAQLSEELHALEAANQEAEHTQEEEHNAQEEKLVDAIVHGDLSTEDLTAAVDHFLEVVEQNNLEEAKTVENHKEAEEEKI